MPSGTIGLVMSRRLYLPLSSKTSFQTGGQGQDGLAGPGLAHQSNDPDAIIQQQFQGEFLLLIQSFDAVNRLAVVRRVY